MTILKIVQSTCYVCNTVYEGPKLLSYNSIMGRPNVKPLACPKCGAPMKPESHFDVGGTKELLRTLVTNEQQAVNMLTEWVRTEADIDRAGEVLRNTDFDQWEKEDLEFAKSTAAQNSKEYQSKKSVRFEKRNQLKELSQQGELTATIQSLVSRSKKQLSEEKAKYMANIPS